MVWDLELILSILDIIGTLVLYGSVEATLIVFALYAVCFGINFSFQYLLIEKKHILLLVFGLVVGGVTGALAWWVSAPLDLQSRLIASVGGPIIWTALTALIVFVGQFLTIRFEKAWIAYVAMSIGALMLTCVFLVVSFGSHLTAFV